MYTLYFASGGYLLSLSLCRRGFQDLLQISPPSLFMLCGCLSSSVASLMIRSRYPVFAERSFVSCSAKVYTELSHSLFIEIVNQLDILCNVFTKIWSWLMLCCATADFSVCASLVCLLCSLILIWIARQPCPIQTWPHSQGKLYTPGILILKASLTGGR